MQRIILSNIKIEPYEEIMNENEFREKYMNLRILKSVQEYLKSKGTSSVAIYPITVPDELVYQITQKEGPEKCDRLIHHIFRIGLTVWSEKLYNEAFGSPEKLEEFIDIVKKRKR
ncbi:MAG TPA: hypothetical protein ENF54_00595 [Desulfobacteraceae bacterium]|nr:hypothetical protein [Desulfobacteraceae bacterium]